MSAKKLTEKEKQRIENDTIVTEEDERNLRMIKYQVHQQLDDVVPRMNTMLDRLEVALPFLEKCGKRHDNHFVWLVVLSIGFGGLGLATFGLYKSVLQIIEVVNAVAITV